MNTATAHDFAAVAASAYPADPEKAAILSALTGFASQRPGKLIQVSLTKIH